MENIITYIFDGLDSVAAFLAALTALIVGVPLKEKLKTSFSSFDKQDHTGKLLKRARHDVWIVANYGDILLKNHKLDIEKCLKRKIHVHYIMLSKEYYPILDKYAGYEPDDLNVSYALKELKKLKDEYPNYIEIRQFNNIITQSYIATDISIPSCDQWIESSIIKVMLYQYHVHTSESPSTFIYYEKDKEKFEKTVESIDSIWCDAKTFDLDNYFS